MEPSPPRSRATLVAVRNGHEFVLGRIDSSRPNDLELVDRILRLQRLLERQGASLRLRDVDDDLEALLHFVGVDRCLDP